MHTKKLGSKVFQTWDFETLEAAVLMDVPF